MIVKSYLTNSLSTISKAVVGIIFLRVFVEYFGKGGVGQIAQVQGLTTLVYAIINGLFFSYVVSAAWRNEKQTKENNINDILYIIILITTIIGIFIFSLKNVIGINLIENKDISIEITILAIMSPIIGIYVGMSAKLCSEGFLTQFNILNASGILVSGVIILLITKYFGIEGVFLAVSIFYLFPAITIIYGYKRYIKTKFSIIKLETIRKFPYKSMLSLSFIGLFMVVSALILKIYVRDQIYRALGWEDVGNWEVISKISDTYLLFLTAPLANYLMPIISRNDNYINNHKIIIKMILAGVIFTISLSIAILLLWDILVLKVIGSQFEEIKKYLILQQAGDVFKIINWTLCIAALAYKKYKFILMCEIIWAILYFMLIEFFLESNKLNGAFIAYIISNGILTIILLSEYLKFKLKIKN